MDVANFQARCNFDFPFFAENVLGINEPIELGSFHKKAMKVVELSSNRFILIIFPRGHLKTTIFSEAYPIWRLWRERNIEIAVTSSALEQSQRIIMKTQDRIEDNEFLKELVPKSRKFTWNKSFLNTNNRNQYYMKPFNDTSRGTHVDYLILDDILRSENITQEQIKEIFWSIFFPTTQTRRGQMIIVGTPMTYDDLFRQIENPDEGVKKVLKEFEFKIIRESAVIINKNGVWLRPLWKERFSLDELKSFKAVMGSLRFSREYLCKPLGTGYSIFKGDLFQPITEGGIIHSDKELNEPEGGWTYYLGWDSAFETGKKADYLVYSIIGEKGNILKQVRQERYKGWDIPKQIKRAEELETIFNFKGMCLEKTGSVGLFKEAQKNPRLKTKLIGFDAQHHKEDLISHLQAKCETKTLWILNNPILIDEMQSFGIKESRGKYKIVGLGKHDDTVIALGLALESAMSKVGRASFSYV